MKQNKADWFSWTLQFIFGGAVAAILCQVFVHGGRRSLNLISTSNAWIFTMGAALVGAALSSYYGDLLWTGSSYRVIPPDAPRHDFHSRCASLMAGLLGMALIVKVYVGL